MIWLPALVAGEFGYFTGLERFLDNAVGAARVDSDQMAVDRRQLPGIFEFSLRIARRREPDPGARFGQAGHGTRIGAMGDDDLSAVQLDIGEEPLVATDQAAEKERVRKSHGVKVGAGPGAFNHANHGFFRSPAPGAAQMP